MAKTDWSLALKPLIKKYKNKPHPLEYKNLYQLMVMVILAAQDSDKHINAIAVPLFKAFPNMEALAATNEAALQPYLTVRNGRNKCKWLLQLAKTVKSDKNIPLSMEELTALPGIGRKSANVIMRGAGVKAEGIVVDLHVVRVAPRMGITKNTDPKKIEEDLMTALPQKDWSEVGMAISFLGRETCRPTHPQHHECIVRDHCAYYHQVNKEVVKP
jgi:endonuclease-3